MHLKWIVPLALASQCAMSLAQAPADYYREDATSFTGLTADGASRITNVTPHTGAKSYQFTRSEGGNRAVETVAFDSDPAPYLRVRAEAWRTADWQGGLSFAAIGATMQYGFTVSGPADSLVPVRFRGSYAINNDSFLTSTNINIALSASGMDFTRADHVGLVAQCDGSAIGYRCFTDSSGYPSLNGSIQSTLNILGFETVYWGAAAGGTFEGVLMAPTDASGMARADVLLGASAYATGAREGGISGISWAFIDPELRIDADYLAQFPDASLRMTPGVGSDMLPVPEASTLAMMLGGLGLLGWAIARPRQG